MSEDPAATTAGVYVDYVDEAHSRIVLNGIHNLLQDGNFTNFTIIVGDEEITSSQLLLSANSSYFRALVLNQFDESTERRVTMEGVTPAIMRMLVTFCSTSRITISQENVYEVLNAANRFGFLTVEEACADMLQKMLTLDNHLEIWCYADERGVGRLVSLCHEFILENILRVLPLNIWREYPLSLVQNVISSDMLNVYNESQIYEGVMTWIKHDPERRQRYLTELFSCIRLDQISLKYLYHVVSEEGMLQDNTICRDIITRIKDKRTLPSCVQIEAIDTKAPRNNSFGSASIFVIGGLGASREPCKKFERFTLNNMTWENVQDFWEPIWGAAATTIEGHVLISGGEGQETRNNLLVCNPATLDVDDKKEVIWDELSPMSVARFGHGMVECMGWAYVIGGYSTEALATCEMYDLYSDRWSNISPLNFARDGPGVVAINNSIYACGGYNVKDYKVVERYDPRIGIWERVPNMEMSRSYGATAVSDGKIYCFGGRQKDKKIRWAEFYDPRASKWESLTDLMAEMSDARAINIGKTIYLLGGLDKDDKPLNLVHSYDPVSTEWMGLPSLTSKRRLMAVTSVGQ